MDRLRNRLHRACWLMAAVLAVTLLADGASAQPTPQQQSAIRSNCRSDFMSKCSGVTPGGKDALVCLQQNVASLSPNCQKAVSATIPAAAPAEAKPAAPTPAPAAAAAPPAPAPVAAPSAPTPAPAATITSVPPPPAATAKPQQAPKPAAAPKPQQAQRPPPPPKQAVVAPAAAAPAAAPPMPSEQQMKAISFTCKREFSRFCKNVVKGGAQQVACLQANAAKLSPDCKTSLADLGDATPAPAVAPPPPQAVRPKAPIVMTAVIGRSCLRDLIKHCRGTGVGDGQKMACLEAHADELTVLCKAAMKVTTPLH